MNGADFDVIEEKKTKKEYSITKTKHIKWFALLIILSI